MCTVVHLLANGLQKRSLPGYTHSYFVCLCDIYIYIYLVYLTLSLPCMWLEPTASYQQKVWPLLVYGLHFAFFGPFLKLQLEPVHQPFINMCFMVQV